MGGPAGTQPMTDEVEIIMTDEDQLDDGGAFGRGEQSLATTYEWRCRAEIAERALRKVDTKRRYAGDAPLTRTYNTIAHIVRTALDELDDLEEEA